MVVQTVVQNNSDRMSNTYPMFICKCVNQVKRTLRYKELNAHRKGFSQFYDVYLIPKLAVFQCKKGLHEIDRCGLNVIASSRFAKSIYQEHSA